MKRILLCITAVIILFIGAPFVFAVNAGSGVILLEPSVVGKTDTQRVQFGEYMSTLFTTFIAVAAVLAVLMIVVGGIQYISSFSIGAKEKGKERIWNAVFGLLIAISAFLILQTVNPDIVSNKTLSLDVGKLPELASSGDSYGPGGVRDENHEERERDQSEELSDWGRCVQNGYKNCKRLDNCTDEADYLKINTNNCSEPALADRVVGTLCCGQLDTDNLKHYYINSEKKCVSGPYNSADECATVNSVGKTSCQTIERVRMSNEALNYPQCEGEGGNTSGIGSWRFQTRIEEQIGDASPSLTTLLSCMRQEIPNKSIGQISSISDSGHIGKLDDCNGSTPSGNCQHGRNSCHYGGGNGANKSMAVDFGDQGNKVEIMRAARKCDSGAYIIDEGNHIHVSTGACPKN